MVLHPELRSLRSVPLPLLVEYCLTTPEFSTMYFARNNIVHLLISGDSRAFPSSITSELIQAIGILKLPKHCLLQLLVLQAESCSLNGLCS